MEQCEIVDEGQITLPQRQLELVGSRDGLDRVQCFPLLCGDRGGDLGITLLIESNERLPHEMKYLAAAVAVEEGFLSDGTMA